MAEPYDGKKIVIVDDDPDIAGAIQAALSDSGAELFVANDGNTALKLVSENEPDVVVLDIMLPQKSGFLVLEKLRQGIASNEKPHVIMITGNQGKRHKQYAEALGVREYINKPFAMEQLTDAIEKWLKK